MITVTHYVMASALLFVIGQAGIERRLNVLMI